MKASKKSNKSSSKQSSTTTTTEPKTPLAVPEDKRKAVPAPLQYQPKASSLFELVATRTVDTFEDVRLHLTRKYFPDQSLKTATKPRVVVLGVGWAGHAFVKTIDTEKYDVVVISPRNYFLFTPMLASSAVGTVEFRSICESIRASNEYIDYIEAECDDIDTEHRTIRCKTPNGNVFDMDYSYLIVSVGASINTFGTPGVKEYCHFLKDVDDARTLRRSILNKFEEANIPGLSEEERARLLTFVIVGGGPTGCEFSAELSDFLRQDVKKHYPKLFSEVSVKLLNSGASILGQFDSALQESALSSLKKGKIDVVLNARVTNVTDKTITLKNGDEIPYGLAVWAAGNGVQPLVERIIERTPEQADAKGRVFVDKWLRLRGGSSEFALGDCAVNPESPLPATGQVAAQQASYIARLLNRNVCLACEIPVHLPSGMSNDVSPEELVVIGEKQKLKFAKPFEFLSLGIMAYVGQNRAVADVDAGDIQVGKLSGRLAFLLWRSVYLTKQVSTRNRVLVLFDWIKTQVFGRDTSLF